MNISELSIRRPVLATVLTIIILLFGLIGYTTLGVREYPSVDNPIISVTCSYPGANAEVIENQITEPLEQNINGIPGIRSLSSTSQQGQCRITVEFELSVDLETAANDVRELLISAPSELNIPYYNKLRDLLDMVEGIEVFEPSHIDECCGFGGMFAVEEQAVSVCMGRDKVKDHMATGAEYIVGADSSCLMHMQGVIKREHLPIQIIHIVEILASQS